MSEVEQILTDFSDGLDFVLEVDADDVPAHDKDFFDRPYLDAKTAITNLIAQEANKARIDTITRALMANPTKDHMLRLWLEDSLELLTAEKGSSNG